MTRPDTICPYALGDRVTLPCAEGGIATGTVVSYRLRSDGHWAVTLDTPLGWRQCVARPRAPNRNAA